MAKPEPAHNQTVEEILASIRQAISEDEVKRGIVPPRAAPPQACQDNVSNLFAVPNGSEQPNGASTAGEDRSQEVIDLAIEKAMDDVRAELENGPAASDSGGDAPSEPELAEPVETVARPSPQPEQRPRALPPRGAASGQTRPLMSPRAGAAVTASFDALARSMAANSGIKLEDMVEGMLRPMLRSWLDDNLPSLVERLVREEIDRVSRGRR